MLGDKLPFQPVKTSKKEVQKPIRPFDAKSESKTSRDCSVSEEPAQNQNVIQNHPDSTLSRKSRKKAALEGEPEELPADIQEPLPEQTPKDFLGGRQLRVRLREELDPHEVSITKLESSSRTRTSAWTAGQSA